jgi:hypothetical protein
MNSLPLSNEHVTQEAHADHLLFRIGGAPFTTYHFADPQAARPYFYPVIGPGGVPMTRAYPMEEGVPNEATDHPHHRSLYVAHGSVNGHDNWHFGARTRPLSHTSDAPNQLTTTGVWETNAGELLCYERLVVTIHALEEEERLIDWHLTLTAPTDTPVHFGDTKEGGLCTFRVAPVLNGGILTNAHGGVGEKECWGKSAKWCDYSAADGSIGVAILHHPQSYGYPTHWHVREYGLFAANPFGLSAFTGGAQSGEYTLPAGQPLVYHCALYLHRGNATTAPIEEIWQVWSAGNL